MTVESGSAAWSAPTARRSLGSSIAPACRIRRTPAATATRSCQAVATVIANAPADSCRCHSAGDIVVFPWGASSTPCSAVNAAITAMLCSTAAASSVSRGVGRSLTVVPAESLDSDNTA